MQEKNNVCGYYTKKVLLCNGIEFVVKYSLQRYVVEIRLGDKLYSVYHCKIYDNSGYFCRFFCGY